VLVFDSMAHEGLPVLEAIEATRAGNPAEVGRQEERVVSSSTDRSSSIGHESATTSQDEESIVVDASEASHNYLFGPPTVTVSYICDMASLDYFTEGDVLAPREEIILEPVR
jgi:hypothetical protein